MRELVVLRLQAYAGDRLLMAQLRECAMAKWASEMACRTAA